MDWKVTKTDGGPYKRPVALKTKGARISQVTIYPMTIWKSTFDNGYVTTHQTMEEAKSYVEYHLKRVLAKEPVK